MDSKELNFMQRSVIQDYDHAGALNITMNESILMVDRTTNLPLGRVPSGSMEGLVMQTKWNANYDTTINDGLNSGMTLFIDKKTNREYLLDPTSPKAKGMKEVK